MSNPVQIFVHERFGKIRVVMIDGEPYFVGKDVATALGYKKPENAIAMHVDDEDKTTTLIQGTGSNYKSKTVIINESGMYALILSSKLEKAREFKHWVTFEVLPSIRKTGSYSLFAPAAEPVADKTAPAAIRPEAIYLVYILLLSNGKVKIGITKRLCERLGEIKRETGLTIDDIYFTPFMLYKDARKVEKCCKEIFFTRRVKGEIFSVDFERACAAVERFVKLVSVKPIDTALNIATVNFVAAEKSK
ncbi:MAG: GIY-YIG nuclease family protein [Quinella sp. 1Q7]|nr:GIY-YIG nuclease family protein [Quinella sp. 1Q7]